MAFHKSALLQQVIRELKVQRGMKYIDATLGGGGHATGVIKQGGIVLGIDQDQDAIDFVKKSLSLTVNGSQLKLAQGNFMNIGEIAKENGFENVSGILFDLGVSSYQLDSAERGFSIRANGPLDMRMDRRNTLTAEYIVNTYTRDQLIDIFQRYGEEDKAGLVADKIIEARKAGSIKTTGELLGIIEGVIKRTGKAHPATKIFQAIRIEVNQELQVVKLALPEALTLLEAHGRLLVISFHSLEDRIIKQQFDMWERKQLGKVITDKPIIAEENEAYTNPRARSAKLRVFEKN